MRQWVLVASWNPVVVFMFEQYKVSVIEFEISDKIHMIGSIL